jgi:hypothetical protein
LTHVARCFRWPVLGLVAVALLVGGSSLAGAAGRRAGSGRVAAPGIGSEITALRTEYSDTFQTTSGHFTTTLATHSVNYRDARGSWQPIGADLVPSLGGGWASGPNRFSATFKAMAGAGLAELTAGGVSFTLAPEGAAPSIASAAGREVSYAAAFPHVDLSYAAEPDSVKETLLLSSPSAPTVYRFLLQPLGGARLSVMQASDGGWVFSRADLGSPVFRLDQPFAIDGVGSTPTGQTPMTMAIVASGTGFAVTLSLSRDWLTDPARKFPVAIDPSVSSNC